LLSDFDIVDQSETSIALSSGDVMIVGELYNAKAKYELHCYVRDLHSGYRFNSIEKLPDKIRKLRIFVHNHSVCRF
jgi:hypothetical protein